jgi:hypothetical protein
MSTEDRDMMKQDLAADPEVGQPQPPPLVEPPNVAETLRLLAKVSRMPDIRFEKVQRMRELISEGKLETPERVAGTVRRLMEELGL